MRKFGIISLILLAAGIFLNMVWLRRVSSIPGKFYIINFEVICQFTIIEKLVVGVIIALLIYFSADKPHLTGTIAILLALPGIFIWGFLLIDGVKPSSFIVGDLDEFCSYLLYLSSALALFIGGMKALLDPSEKSSPTAPIEKQIIQPRQDECPIPQPNLTPRVARSSNYIRLRSKL